MDNISHKAVKARFDAWNDDTAKAALIIRKLIFTKARQCEGVGEIIETLKWNQPAYLPLKTGTGTTIRLDEIKATGDLGIYFHCQTNLVENFRNLYDGILQFEKNRAIILQPGKSLPLVALEHCIAMALTYHIAKKTGK